MTRTSRAQRTAKNSITITIPKEYAKKLEIQPGTIIEWTMQGVELTLRRLK